VIESLIVKSLTVEDAYDLISLNTKTIFDKIEYQKEINTLRKEMAGLWKTGVVSREWKDGEFFYTLTKKGEFLFKNGVDYFFKKRKAYRNSLVIKEVEKERSKDKEKDIQRVCDDFTNYYQNYQPFRNLVNEYGKVVSQNVTLRPKDVVKNIKQINMDLLTPKEKAELLSAFRNGESAIEGYKPDSKPEISETAAYWRKKYYESQRNSKGLRTEKAVEKRKKTIAVKEDIVYGEKLKRLAHQFTGYQLTESFFREINVRPAFIMGNGVFAPKSIEIMSEANKEIRRGHWKGWLNPQQITQCNFRARLDGNHLVITSPYMEIPYSIKLF